MKLPTLRILFVAFLAIPFLSALWNVLQWAAVVSVQNSPNDYSDAVIITSNIYNLYPSLAKIPYHLDYYTPGIYYAVALLAKLPWNIFQEGEALGSIASLGIAVMVYLISRRLCGSVGAASAAALSYLASLPVLKAGSFIDPEGVSLVFGLLALYLAMNDTKKSYLVSGLLFGLALLFKQDSVIVLASLCVYLVAHRKFRPLAWVLAPVAVTTLPVLGALDYLSQGRLFLEVVLLPLWTPHSGNGPVVKDLPMFEMLGILLALASVEAAVLIVRRRVDLISIAFAISWPVSLWDASKIGASWEYLFLPMALTCILTAPYYAKVVEFLRSPRAPRLTMKIALVALMGVLILGQSTAFSSRAVLSSGVPTFGLHDELVLSEAPAINYLEGGPQVFEPSTFWVLQIHGVWNDSALVRMVEDRSFAAVVILTGNSRYCWYPSLLSAIENNYVMAGQSQGYYLLVPGNPTPHHHFDEACSAFNYAGITGSGGTGVGKAGSTA